MEKENKIKENLEKNKLFLQTFDHICEIEMINQKQLAEQLGTSSSVISNYRSGNKAVSNDIKRRLSEKCNNKELPKKTSQMANQNDNIDAVIANYEKVIKAKDELIQSLQDRLKEKDELFAEIRQRLADKDSMINDIRSNLTEKDEIISLLKTTISDLRHQIATLNPYPDLGFKYGVSELKK